MNSPTAATVPAEPLAILDPAPGVEPARPAEAPSAEQLRAIEAVFAQSAENSAALGLLGLWASTVLLKDLACEHFHLPAEEKHKHPLTPNPSTPFRG